MTRITVPKLKHAPVTLGRQLQDYLKDPDFELNRRQFLLEKENKKKGGKVMEKDDAKPSSNKLVAAASATSQPNSQLVTQPAKGPDTNLIDLFDSLDDHQTTMVFQTNPQPMGTTPWSNQTPVAFQQMQSTALSSPQPGLISQPTVSPTISTGVMGAADMVNMSPQPQQQLAPPMQPQPTAAAAFGGFASQLQIQSFSPTSLGSIPQNAAVST
ncbi:MAG: hypothetical protein MJA30_31960, partial [Cytophagales bacterium]|nr:hypothetical protein [Cytophagales bacterium]